MTRWTTAIFSIFVVAGSLLSIGCDREESPDGVEEPDSAFDVPFPRNDWACTDANLDRIERWHDRYTDAYTLGQFVPGVPAVDDAARASEPDITLQVTRDEVMVERTRVGGPAGLVDHPRKARFEIVDYLDATGGDETASVTIGVAAAEDVSAATVVELLEEIGTSLVDQGVAPAFVAVLEAGRPEGVEPVPEPLRDRAAEWAAERERTNPQEALLNTESSAQEKAYKKAVEECSAIERRWREADPRSLRPAEKREAMREINFGGLRECDCEADVELFMTTLALGGGPARHGSFAPLVRRSGEWRLVVGEGEQRRIEGDRPWRELIPNTIGSPLAPTPSIEPSRVD